MSRRNISERHDSKQSHEIPLKEAVVLGFQGPSIAYNMTATPGIETRVKSPSKDNGRLVRVSRKEAIHRSEGIECCK